MNAEREVACRRCGAVNAATRAKCWICRSPIDSQAPASPPVAPTLAAEREGRGMSPAMAIVLTVVCGGLFLQAPGLAILLLITAGPAWLICLESPASDVSGASLFLRALVKVIAVLAVIVVSLAIAAFVAVWVICNSTRW